MSPRGSIQSRPGTAYADLAGSGTGRRAAWMRSRPPRTSADPVARRPAVRARRPAAGRGGAVARGPERRAARSGRGSHCAPSPTGARPRRRVAGSTGGGRRLRPVPDERRLRDRRVRLRSRVHHQDLPAAAAAAGPVLVPGRGPRRREPARPTARRCWSPTTPAPCRWTGWSCTRSSMTRSRRHVRMLGADLIFKTPFSARPCPQDRHHAGLPGGRRAAAGVQPAGRGLPGGLQGPRQAVRRPLQAAAVRPGRLRLGRHPRPGADHPGLDRRVGGDLPADQHRAGARPGAGRAVLPGDAVVPLARRARA